MILRKPYAFLIKRFKLIHFILTGLMLYLILRTNNVLTYFNNYVSEGVLKKVLASDYINLFMFFIAILIIGISIIVYLLMKFKKKPKLVYLISIIGYFLVFVMTWITLSVMKDLEFNILDTRVIRLTRDFLMMSLIFQVGMTVVMLIRALGFDIKKFNFADDIAELDIDVSDNEEFELVVGVDINKVTRKSRRKFREFKYFVLENKFIFTLIGIISSTLIVFIIFLNMIVFNKVYKEGQSFRTTLYTMNVMDSYLTEKTYDQNIIKTNNKVFVVIKLKIKGIYENLVLKRSDMRLVVNNTKYYPNIKYYNQLSDIGRGYTKQKIGKDEKEYILAYEVDVDNIDKKMILTYVDQIKFTNAGIEAKYKKVNIKPYSLDTSTLVKSVNLGEEVNLNGSLLGNNILKISEYKIENNFTYQYDACVNSFCSKINDMILPNSTSNKKLNIMELNMSFSGDLSTYEFISKFGKLYYNINGEEKVYNKVFVNKTPNTYKGNNTYIEIYEEIKNASSIWFEFNIRDKKYNYLLKQS